MNINYVLDCLRLSLPVYVRGKLWLWGQARTMTPGRSLHISEWSHIYANPIPFDTDGQKSADLISIWFNIGLPYKLDSTK